MTTLSHPQVRALLQAAAEKPLLSEERAGLNAHLAGCSECRAYAENLDELQAGLRRVMNQQWNRQPAPPALHTIKERSGRVAAQNRIAGTLGRFAVLPLLAFAFVLAVRMMTPPQMGLEVGALTASTPQLSRRTPTPSPRNLSAELTAQECQKVVYIVQQDDTLDSIAARYHVPREYILIYNGLASDSLAPGTQLVIPLCDLTPTGTSTTAAMNNATPPLSASIVPSPPG